MIETLKEVVGNIVGNSADNNEDGISFILTDSYGTKDEISAKQYVGNFDYVKIYPERNMVVGHRGSLKFVLDADLEPVHTKGVHTISVRNGEVYGRQGADFSHFGEFENLQIDDQTIFGRKSEFSEPIGY